MSKIKEITDSIVTWFNKRLTPKSKDALEWWEEAAPEDATKEELQKQLKRMIIAGRGLGSSRAIIAKQGIAVIYGTLVAGGMLYIPASLDAFVGYVVALPLLYCLFDYVRVIRQLDKVRMGWRPEENVQ